MPVKKKNVGKYKKTVVVKTKKVVARQKAVQTNPRFDVYKKNLLKTKEQITGDIRNLFDENSGSGNDRSGDISGHALHMADVATDMYDREFTLGLASTDRELLFEVDEALGRIQDGTFGACDKCKKPIPVTRLKAIPHARTCLKCQEKIEFKHK